jgi:F-type H+-transporting ATPase subunit a
VEFVGEPTIMSWVLMILLLVLAWLVKRELHSEGVSTLQNVFELFMEKLRDLIEEVVGEDPDPYVPLIGTLFIFVFFSNVIGSVPGLESPTGEISVTAGLAAVVFFAVPFYGIMALGFRTYMSTYLSPHPLMLPFNVLTEFTRTLALAMRLFGNIMSGNLLFLIIVGVVAQLLKGTAPAVQPFGYVVALPLTLFIQVLGLITAVIHAYIFAVLALVYIGAATEKGLPAEAGEEEGATEDSPQESQA